MAKVNKLKAMKLYNYLCTIDRVIDGDTVDVIVDMGFYLYQTVRIRLLNVNTPERGEEEWNSATEALKDLIKQGEKVDKKFWLITHKTGKFGRWLGSLLSYDKEIAINITMCERWPARNSRVI
jgi:micrococcal nuclease